MNDIFQQNEDNILLLTDWMSNYKGLVAGFTTRLSGVSHPPYDSNNIGLHVNDNEHDVISNRQLLCKRLGFPFESFTCAEQVHSNLVTSVSSADKGKGRLSVSDTIKGADGIVTSESNILLTSFYADCVPLLFVDPIQHVIGLAHAGWKGTVGAIAKQTINKMVTEYSCELESIHVAIGPSIGACCYEVDQTVTHAVHALWNDEKLPLASLNKCIKQINEKKAYINLKEINRQIMIKAGIMSSHIEISKLCTGCSTELFFSHRVEGGKTGRMASFIGWQEGDA